MGGGDVRSDRHRRHDRRAAGPLFCQCKPQGPRDSQRNGNPEPGRLREPHAFAQRDACQDPDAISGQEPDSFTGDESDSVSVRQPDAFATIASYASGDARNALNALDVAASLALSQTKSSTPARSSP